MSAPAAASAITTSATNTLPRHLTHLPPPAALYPVPLGRALAEHEGHIGRTVNRVRQQLGMQVGAPAEQPAPSTVLGSVSEPRHRSRHQHRSRSGATEEGASEARRGHRRTRRGDQPGIAFEM